MSGKSLRWGFEIIQIEKHNSVYNKIHCDAGIAQELGEYFTFSIPGARFIIQQINRSAQAKGRKPRRWDGKIRLFNTGTHLLYGGLNRYIEQFAYERNYPVEYMTNFAADEFSVEEALQFCKKLDLKLEPRDYQLSAFVHGVRNKRTLLLSPTASGKSFIIFLLVCYVLSRTDRKCLVIVPTTSLVHQMVSDFQSYSSLFTSLKHYHKIMSGTEKDSNARIYVSTWQSIYKHPKAWFDQFSMVVGDEAHLFKADSLTSIMKKMTDCDYRFGFTGTLDGTHTHKLVLEGLFGHVKKVTTTADLIEQKHLADFRIKCLILQYNDDHRKFMKGQMYKDEIDWIVRHPPRNNFIKNLALSLAGNTLILYQFVDKHGKELYELIKNSTEKRVVFIHGDVDSTIREDVRALAERENNLIIVASYGTFSTGVNIKNLHNVVFASPSKSRIRNLQSIGRGLRKSDTKTIATLYDISDDLAWKTRKNHTLSHFEERIKIYGEEKFDYKIYTINLKG